MKLTPEQKSAFDLANRVCAVIKRGRNQYAVISAWRELNGPRTETNSAWPYFAAQKVRIRHLVWDAMIHLGYDHETCESAVPDYTEGRALQVFKEAIQKAGPVEC